MIIENRNKSKEKMGNVLACAHYALPQFTIQNAAVSGYASLFYSSALLSMDRQAKRVWDSALAFVCGFRDRCLSRSYADPASRQAGDVQEEVNEPLRLLCRRKLSVFRFYQTISVTKEYIYKQQITLPPPQAMTCSFSLYFYFLSPDFVTSASAPWNGTSLK
jgi:hypothetical protein